MQEFKTFYFNTNLSALSPVAVDTVGQLFLSSFARYFNQ